MRIIENLETILDVVKIEDNRIVISHPLPQEDSPAIEQLHEDIFPPQEDEIDEETRKKVENAAIEVVVRYYEENGWVVDKSPQDQRGIGYDLKCHWRNVIECAEVKGIGGSEENLILSANELRALEEKPDFVLWLVTSALDEKCQKLHKYTKEEYIEKFDYEPSMYHFKPKSLEE